MTIAELIAELSKLPPHLPVAVGVECQDYEACDVDGDPITFHLDRDMECFGLGEVLNEGRVVRLIGTGMHWETL